MIRDPEQSVTNIAPGDQPYEVLLDQLAELAREGDDEKLDAFFKIHPEDEARLRQMLPSLRALAVLDTSEELPSKDDPALADNTLGDFRNLQEIGRGGMGVVYEAQQISLPRRVAIKVLPFAAVLDPRQLERFKNEARAAATLDHPGIVSIYSVGCERGVHFFAMQFVEGQSLAEVIAELQCDDMFERSVTTKAVAQSARETVEFVLDGTEPSKSPSSSIIGGLSSSGTLTHCRSFFQFAARIGVQAAEALDHAHARGIIHRDIKPGNVLLDADGKAHIADFGLARIESEASVTMAGDILGTLRYMSPEQALAKRVVVDHRTDVYSLGVTLYELVTLAAPFTGDDQQKLLRQIALEEPIPPGKLNHKIPKDLETVILKAMAKDVGDRYSTALDLAQDLQRFLDNRPIEARRPGVADRMKKMARRHQTVVWSTAVILLVTALVSVASSLLIFNSYQREKQQRMMSDRQTERAELQTERAETLLYAADMRQAGLAWQSGDLLQAVEFLEKYRPEPGQLDLRGYE
jgi:serine/threonine protein kinase